MGTPPEKTTRPTQVARNPFAPFASFVGRIREINEVKRLLQEGQAALLIGGRRAGKTALIGQIKDIEVAIYNTDVSAWQLETLDEVLSSIGHIFGEQCSSKRKAEEIIAKHTPLALVIDEADRLLARSWTDDFFVWLRYLNDTRFRRDLSFLLAGGPALWRYRNPRDNGSPAFNTSTKVFLSALSAEECTKLCALLGKEVDIDALLRQCGGHPWLLNRVLERIWFGNSLVDAVASVASDSIDTFDSWVTQLGQDGFDLAKRIEEGSLSQSDLNYNGRLWRQFGRAWVVIKCLCLADETSDSIELCPGIFVKWLLPQKN